MYSRYNLCNCGKQKIKVAKQCKCCSDHSEIRNKKISISRLASKNPMWKGNKVGIIALHNWVKLRLPKPDLCRVCQIKPAYDLANKGKYNRELKNWNWLCRHCHMIQDGRMKNLKQFKKPYSSKEVEYVMLLRTRDDDVL